MNKLREEAEAAVLLGSYVGEKSEAYGLAKTLRVNARRVLILEEALLFYASKGNYLFPMSVDMGEEARKALKEAEEVGE